jgi:hypothetical protein
MRTGQLPMLDPRGNGDSCLLGRCVQDTRQLLVPISSSDLINFFGGRPEFRRPRPFAKATWCEKCEQVEFVKSASTE